MKPINPTAVAAPGGPYQHGLLLEAPGRWLFISGQVPLAFDGGIPDGISEQTEMVWNQVEAIHARKKPSFLTVAAPSTRGKSTSVKSIDG